MTFDKKPQILTIWRGKNVGIICKLKKIVDLGQPFTAESKTGKTGR